MAMWVKTTTSEDRYVNLGNVRDVRVSSPDSGTTWVITALPTASGTIDTLAGTFASEADAEAALLEIVTRMGYAKTGS